MGLFSLFILSEEIFLTFLFYPVVYSVLNTLSEYTHFCISKNITSYTFLLVFKIFESLQCILNFVKIQNQLPQSILKVKIKKLLWFYTICLCYFVFKLKKKGSLNKENCFFCFTSKVLLVHEVSKFQNLKFHDVIKCLNMIQKLQLTELRGE